MRARVRCSAVVALVGLLVAPPAAGEPAGLSGHDAHTHGAGGALQSAASAQAAGGRRLVIGRIGVNAPIRTVGITADGGLAVGSSASTVYRWKDGVTPGQRGSAVLAGHTWEAGDGVFDHLARLRKGNVIRVGKHRFKVTRKQRVQRMGPAQVAALYADTGPARIVLITCGDRDAQGTYHSRILVRARKVR